MSDQDKRHVGSNQPPGPAGVMPAWGGGMTGERAAGAVPRPGDRIHQYEILEMIGEGGMGTVFLARDLRLGRDVAIKFLQAGQPELMQRFLVEARTTARCQHDNIVVIHEVGEHDAMPYLVLELLHGTPLARLTDGGQPVPYPRAVEIVCSVLRALQCAHEHGIVHRDLKPDNIFLTAAGTIKVLDFGIAKVLPASPDGEVEPAAGAIRRARRGELTTGTDTGLTQAGTIVGTLAYMSPEQWGIGVEIDHQSDLWACGILMHRMICGRHPLDPLEGPQLAVTAMLELAMPSMAAAAPPGVPRALIEIVDRCLRKAKAQRWQSAAELLSVLERFLAGRRTQPRPPDRRRQLGRGPVVARPRRCGVRARVVRCSARPAWRRRIRSRLPPDEAPARGSGGQAPTMVSGSPTYTLGRGS